MRSNTYNAILAKLGLAASILLLTGGVSLAQTVNLTAAPANASLPDGAAVPMWGYSCGSAVTGSTATCAALNPAAAAAGTWSPVVITTPAGSTLVINLTNNLPTPPGGTGIPTSLVIVGQLGGGLGGTPTRTASPTHAPQGTTWPGTLGGTGPDDTVFTPPSQSDRVQSFGTEVATGATTPLTWANLRPGTYLIESGTHPSIQGPMGLYGMLVVTTKPDATTTPATPGTAYPAAGAAAAVTYDADLPLLLSEIAPVQNAAVAQAVATAGFSETKVWNGQASDPTNCGLPTVHSCYPPAVNYDPRYYLINGVSFDQTAQANSLFPVSAPASTGQVLVRFVNAGLRMHVPTIVGAQTGNPAVSGMALVAEDGNRQPGNYKIQNEVFLSAGKTFDVLLTAPAAAATLPVFDRQLSLSTNNQRDGGMQAYITVNGGTAPSTGQALTAATKSYYCVSGATLSVTDPGRGVLAGATGANGAALVQPQPAGLLPAGASLTFEPNGTFTYTPPAMGSCAGSFTYLVNGTLPRTATIAQCDASVQAAGCTLSGAPTAAADLYTSNIASKLQIVPPGVLGNDKDPASLPMKASAATGVLGGTVTLNPDGSFTAIPACAPNCASVATMSFQYTAINSQNSASTPVSVSLSFQAPSNLTVNVKDAKNGRAITDYRWIIEEDRTFWIDPKCQINSTDPSVRPITCAPLPVESLGYNFHTANMPVVAQGCVGSVSCENGQTILGTTPVACDVGNGICRTDAAEKTAVLPGQVHLDPAKRYFISVLPGDGENTTLGGSTGPIEDASVPGGLRQFEIAKECGAFDPSPGTAWEPGGASALCGHAMGGAQIAAGRTVPVNIVLQETPLPTSKLAVFVFQDDNPLNGENDAGGGVDILAPNEPGLGGFEVKLFDQAGGLGDATGQITYDMFNMPVSNSLAGMKDPLTGFDACPISPTSADGIVGMVPTCPTMEADGVTLSPLAGQAVIANLYPGLYEVVATPSADRAARGEEWLQTNTLDGGKPHEAFIKPNEPGYFQEFGPGNFHVSIGFANPKIINDRKTNAQGTGICDPAGTPAIDPVTLLRNGGGGLTCTATLNGSVSNARMSRTPDQRIYSSGGYGAYGFTQCYIGLGAPDEADFAFTKCDADGKFTFTNIPTGDFKITVFDQWNDLMLDGLVSPVHVDGSTTTIDFPVTQWRTDLYTRTFIDTNGDGVSQPEEPGLALVSTNIRYRDGSYGFFNNTDLDGYAGFNEVFPFMNWLVVETSTTRFKQTGAHVVYDAGGQADGAGGGPGGVGSAIADGLANTLESVHLPPSLRVPGAVYCADADCTGASIANGPGSSAANPSAGRIDPPWATTQGWQGLLGQSSFIEFGMAPFAAGENGGIFGHVIYASTRPFDDPALSLQLQWEPGVPRVKINLYREDTAADGTKSLKLVDTTTTTSFDDWAQGFRSDGMPNMNCPGQASDSPFFATLKDSKQWLDPAKRPLPNNSQFKCYDGWSQLNQVQPAPYDGMYKFPSVTSINPATGKPAGTNCDPTVCVNNPTGDGTKMLPQGKYVVEVVVPPGLELVKEEDKNILLGDVYIAPVTQQFAGLGNIFILPDQAAITAYYNPQNPGALNATTNLGATPRHEGDTGSVESFWPCVGATRIVPDYNSLYPAAGQAAPFAGASRPLCDRKEVTLEDQMTVTAKFYLFSSTHIAAHFAGTITNDFASEFDPFSPQFGEKFGPPNLPVGLRDFTGNEVGRVYSDQWGIYNGLFFSSYGVNPPNPTGYVPQMAIACMNDPGPIPATNTSGQMIDANGGVVTDPALAKQITDPAYNPAYSNFCYETAFMPGFTAYMDTPVIPTMAFADGYNLPDSEYPDATPAIGTVTGSDGIAGPWVSASGAGHTLTITALGDKVVQNPAFSGPNSTVAPFNQKTITRHYGFGSTPGTVTIGGANAALVGPWSDTSITVTVPTLTPAQSTCTVVQRTTPSSLGNSARCGELAITAANGKKSIDAITVTIAGKPPTYVTPTSSSSTLFGQTFPNPLQNAIDNAAPGDLIIVAPGTYKENLLMWKPVRLQGVGAASVTINADAHPAGKMDPWRRQVNCLFGLTLQGVPNLGNNQLRFDPAGLYTCPAKMYLRSDRIPFEGLVGWDASSNGNLAQVLQEPTLMGAYEGAGITVLGRGIRVPNNNTDFWGQVGGAGTFPDGSTYLTGGNNDCTASTTSTNGRDYGTGNFLCNPSRIDGVSIINSSQGGGGIFAHGWNHNLEIANTRISANHGTLSGGINVGNGETPPAYVNDGTICGNGVPAPRPLCPPLNGTPANGEIPFQLNINVHVHHNSVTNNASLGDALFSGTPSGAGGVTFSAGDDNYLFDHNWISGNLATGDGAGVVHSGFIANGKILNNWILFNQSTNPTIPTNGGGLAIEGANSDRTLSNGQECGTFSDVDCPPGIGDGTGPGLVIDSNLIMGNSSESGSGGGLRLQQTNGTEVVAFPTRPDRWYGVTVSNNIIANNVAGWDGAGVSMQDALKVNFINNTVVSNDTTGSAGVLFKALGAPMASAPPPGCNPQPNPLLPQDPNCLGHDAPSVPQPAGLVTIVHTPNLRDSMAANTICPSGFGYGTGVNSCRSISRPSLTNDLFWQNRAFHIEIAGMGGTLQDQQNVVVLTPALNQNATGACMTTGTAVTGAPSSGGPVSYWEVGVRGDTSATAAGAGNPTLSLSNSILTDLSGRYTGNGNLAPSSSPVNALYCNGARVPPENTDPLNPGHGYNAPPGRSETTGLSKVFLLNNIAPAATVDEGTNWINLGYGPLSLYSTAGQSMLATGTNGPALGAYSTSATSVAVNNGSNSGAPNHDFFGNPRPAIGNPNVDIGAVEVAVPNTPLPVVSPASLAFGSNLQGTTSASQNLTLSNNGGAAFTITSIVVTSPFSRIATGGFPGGAPNCGAAVAAGASCTIKVVYTAPATVGASTGTVTITGNAAVTNSPVQLTGSSVAPTHTASVSPNPLAFGNWATGTTSTVQSLTVTNTGNSALAGLTYTFGGGTPQPFSRTGGSCGTTLAVAASCTVNVTFAPGTAVAFSRTLTVAGTGVTVTPASVTLTGTGVATRATASITPNPLTITLPSGPLSITGTGVLSFKNTAPVGGAQISVSNIAVSGGSIMTYFFNVVAGSSTCTAALAPQATCTVTVRFTNTGSPRGTNRAGTITFTDNATGSPQSGGLIGFATP